MRNQHRCIPAVIGCLRTLHGRHPVPIPGSLDIILCHLASRIADIVSRAGLLRNRTVTIYLRNSFPTVLSFTQIIRNSCHRTIVRLIIVVLEWAVRRLGQGREIARRQSFRLAIPEPVNLQTIWINFKVPAAAMSLKYAGLFQKTDLVAPFQFRRFKRSLVSIKRIQNSRGRLRARLIRINCWKFDFLWLVCFIMSVFKVLKPGILWLLLHHHIRSVWKHC